MIFITVLLSAIANGCHTNEGARPALLSVGCACSDRDDRSSSNCSRPTPSGTRRRPASTATVSDDGTVELALDPASVARVYVGKLPRGNGSKGADGPGNVKGKAKGHSEQPNGCGHEKGQGNGKQ